MLLPKHSSHPAHHFPTLLQGHEDCGFTSRMGGRGSVPRLLRLKPEDAARTGGKPFAKVSKHACGRAWLAAGDE